MAASSTLVLGYGNPARRDDGLGPAFAAALAARSLPGVEVESPYQLQVEDAAELGRHCRVVFVDADRRGPAPFSLHRVWAAPGGISFTSHSVAPGALLALARCLFGAEPEAWLVGIRGYDFDDFGEELSPEATSNLEAALDHLGPVLASGAIGTLVPPASLAPS